MGGAMLRAQPQEQELDISGSIVVARAATAEEVLAVLKEDIYAHTGVWDLKNVQIYPVRALVLSFRIYKHTADETTVGYFAIQMARLHGHAVITTCSPRNFELARRAGATHVFDYNDPEVTAKIRSAAPDLAHVFDTIGSATSSATACEAIDGRPGVLCTVRPGKANTGNVPQNVQVTDVFVFTAFPTPHSYRGAAHWPINMPDHELSVELYDQLPTLLAEGKLVPPAVKVVGELGPETVAEAMNLNRSGKISGEKLCFKLSVDAADETEGAK
ncbi:hypothetical protein ACHAQF_006959 [Verticillium nonalfalfae]